MARIFLTSGETSGPYGGFATDTITGTNDNEVVYVAGNGKAVFTADFNRGGDTIYINGLASAYTASINSTSTQLTLTAANGANIVIPIGTNGVDIVFNGDDTRQIYFDTGLNSVYLGEQALAGGSTTAVTPGDVVDPTGDTFRLEATRDDLTGTDGNDLFRARVSQNQNGEQTNELGSGDFIDGGAGDDELFATVQDASALNGNPVSEIAPVTTDVETIRITAQQARSSEDDDSVEFSAEEMYGVERIISYRSDASLTFYNVNTLTDEPTPGSNVDQGARSTDNIEICMEYTAGDNGLFEASDMLVLFDNDFLIPPGADSDTNRVRLQIMDIDNQILTNRPLLTNPFDILILTFDTGGTGGDGDDSSIQLFLDPAAYRNGLTGAAAYQALVDGINEAIDNSSDPRLATFEASLGAPFQVSDTDDDPVVNGIGEGFEINITDTSGSDIKQIDFGASGVVPGDTDYHKQTFFNVAPAELPLIQVDVCFEKVGNGTDGGGLVVGAMGEGNDGIPSGVEQFNVTVNGTDAQDSSVAYLSSTYNTLEEVYVVSEAGSTADLIIGNSHTFDLNEGVTNGFGFGGVPNGAGGNDCDVVDQRNNALTDVRVFDSTGFAGDLTLWANLSDEVVDKYLDTMDDDVNAADDNRQALYTFGAGDDTLSMSLSTGNMAFEGNTTREDFIFTVNSGDGDDTVLVQIGDGEAILDGQEWFDDNGDWYTNHLLNDNLNIITGAGDDYVNTWGASAARIDTGSGDDVVFTDNSGVDDEAFNCGMATWVFNSRDVDVEDIDSGLPFLDGLESRSVASVSNVANVQVVVQYMDFQVTVNLGNTVGSINGETVTDLTINQAIKDAINNNDVLSDFLVAEDGPGRTLIVRSLVDGEAEVTDLTVRLQSSGALTPAQVAGTALGITDLTEADLAELGFGLPAGGTSLPLIDTGDDDDNDFIDGAGRYDSDFGFDSTGFLNGIDSNNVNNNRVNAGTGNDEIALSSNGDSIEHIVITGAFGTDHILHFSAGVEATPEPAVAEVQTLTFTVDDGDDIDADGDLETTEPITIIVTVNGVEYPVAVPAGSEAEDIAALVATEILAAPEVASTSTDGDGTVTINYTAAAGDVPQATAEVDDIDRFEETQTVVVTGVQEDAETVTVTIDGFNAGNPGAAGTTSFDIDIPAGSSPAQIEQIIVTYIQTDPDNLGFEAAGITASVNDGDGNFIADGTFTINFSEDYNENDPGPGNRIDPVATTFVFTETGDEDNAEIEVTESERTPATDVTIDEDTTVPFEAAETGLVGFDIFDFSSIIGAGGPEYFENTMNFGAGEDADPDGTTGTEYAAINNLIDSNANGVILIDEVNADARTELQELQALVTAADNGSNVPAGTTDTSIIFTVYDSARADYPGVSGDDGDDDGLFANVYQVVDGAAAGETNNVTYLGTVYLGGSDNSGNETYGDFEALTAVNFTPLTPTEIIDQLGSII